MRKTSIVLLLSLLILTSHGQKTGQSLIDSLLPELPAAKEDTLKATNYHTIAQAYMMIDPARGMLYADTGMALARQLKWKKGIAFFHFLKGNILSDRHKVDEAIAEYEKGYAISKEINHLRGMSTALNDIGGAYFLESDHTKAISYYTRSLEIAELIKEPNLIGTSYSNIATVYYTQKNYAKAIDYSTKALVYYEKLGDPNKIARTYTYIGNVYYEKQDNAKAKEYYEKALKTFEQTNNKTGMAIVYSQIGILFEPDYQKIIEYQERSQAIWESINPTHYNSIINLCNIGESYLNSIRADSLKKLSADEKRLSHNDYSSICINM